MFQTHVLLVLTTVMTTLSAQEPTMLMDMNVNVAMVLLEMVSPVNLKVGNVLQSICLFLILYWLNTFAVIFYLWNSTVFSYLTLCYRSMCLSQLS